jgi:hypothetical protein
MLKNTANQNVAAQMIDTDGEAVTTGITLRVTKDGGTPANSAGTLTHKENGHWNYVPTQAETDADHVTFRFSGNSSIAQLLQTYPLSPISAEDVAAEILETPANKLKTDGSGEVTAENMRGTDNAVREGVTYEWDNEDGQTQDVTINTKD